MSHALHGSTRARLEVAVAIIALACVIPIAACGNAKAEGKPLPKNAAGIAVDAYVYGYPPVLSQLSADRIPPQTLLNINAVSGPQARAVVLPNVDTTYTVAIRRRDGGRRAVGQRREGERVTRDDPLQLREVCAEVILDRRQRDVHDGVVEHDHEEAERDGGQRPPLASLL